MQNQTMSFEPQSDADAKARHALELLNQAYAYYEAEPLVATEPVEYYEYAAAA